MRVLVPFSGIGGFSLALNEPECEPSPSAKSIRSAGGCSRGTGQMFPATTTSNSYWGASCRRWNIATSSAADSPARTSRPQARAQALPARSGLWKEYARIIGEVRPRYAIIENVAALLHRGLWRRSLRPIRARVRCGMALYSSFRRWCASPTRPDLDRGLPRRVGRWQAIWTERDFRAAQSGPRTAVRDASDADSEPPGRLAIAWGECGHWLVEPDVGRVAHGVPARVDRLRVLGNAVVPQIPEIIGQVIMNVGRGDSGQSDAAG